MLAHVPRADAALWVIYALLQSVLLWRLIRTRVSCEYRAFTLFLCFASLKTAVLMFVPFGDGGRLYGLIHYPSSVIVAALALGSVVEVSNKTFGSRLSLPSWIPRDLRLTTVIIVAASVAASLLIRPRFGSSLIQTTGQIRAAFIIGSVLWLGWTIGYSMYWRMTWLKRDAQIAKGWALFLAVNLLTLGVIWFGRRDVGLVAQRINSWAAIVTLGWWNWRFWEKGPALEGATEDMVNTVLAELEETETISCQGAPASEDI